MTSINNYLTAARKPTPLTVKNMGELVEDIPMLELDDNVMPPAASLSTHQGVHVLAESF